MLLISSCSYRRTGSLTIVSTRNFESKIEYKLIQKEVTGKAKVKKGESLQRAIDDAIGTLPEGEFMKNVGIYIKSNGKKTKVIGDVWGVPSVNKQVEKSVTLKVEFKVGDTVTFKNSLGKIVEGTILGVNSNTAIIEHKNSLGKITKSEIKYEDMTKLGN